MVKLFLEETSQTKSYHLEEYLNRKYDCEKQIAILQQMQPVLLEVWVLIHCLGNCIQDDDKEDETIEVWVHDELQADLDQAVLVVRLRLVNDHFLGGEQLLQERIFLF